METNKDRILEIAGFAFTITVAFHFLVAEHAFGLGFAIFAILLAIGTASIAHLQKGARNNWAFLFLLPVLFGAATHVLYASETSRALAFFLTFGALILFAYWYTRPKIAFCDVISFWPKQLAFETMWPFPSLGEHLVKIKSDKRLSSILLGIGISVPFLLIFLSLFTSADQLFAKSFNDLFQTIRLGEIVVKTIRDIIVGLFFLSSGFVMFTRLNKYAQDKVIKNWNWVNQTTLATFLVMLNLLFIIFVGFQAAYFFGGEALIKAQGLTYSEYAVSGFFELLFVAGLVFGITWFIYRGTNMKNRLSGVLCVALIAQTGVIIASAMSRLLLYIDIYGLTLSRFWAAYCIILIGFVLTAGTIGIAIKINYAKIAKMIFLGSVLLTSTVLLFNIEGFIASYNIERYLNDKNQVLDTYYLVNNLSGDALIPLAKMHRNFDWDNELTWNIASMEGFYYKISREKFSKILERERMTIEEIFEHRWLAGSVSHYRAYISLGDL